MEILIVRCWCCDFGRFASLCRFSCVNADGYVNRSAQLLLRGRQNHIVPDVLWLIHKWQIRRYTNAFMRVLRIVAIHSTKHGELKSKLTYDMPMVLHHFALHIFVAMKMVYMRERVCQCMRKMWFTVQAQWPYLMWKLYPKLLHLQNGFYCMFVRTIQIRY